MARKKTVNITPDAAVHAPATAVTPEQIADSQRQIAALIDTGASCEVIAEAERRHQEMCAAQVEQLRAIYFQRRKI